jgi:hypothetical protein
MLSVLTEARVARSKDSDDATDKFKLPGAGVKLELTRKAQKQIITWVILGVGVALSHVVHYLLWWTK